LITEKVGDVLGFLPNIGTTIFPIFIHILEFLEGFDDIYVVTEV